MLAAVFSGASVYHVAVVASFVIASLASPAGVFGVVLLLPFQVAVLGTPSPVLTLTNLLYNFVATPGALHFAVRCKSDATLNRTASYSRI